jgi:hypothetical protein
MENINLELLRIACDLASRNYTPENRGVFDEMKKERDIQMTYTPSNIKAIYDELTNLFNSTAS